jgi:hypothetical protein
LTRMFGFDTIKRNLIPGGSNLSACRDSGPWPERLSPRFS